MANSIIPSAANVEKPGEAFVEATPDTAAMPNEEDCSKARKALSASPFFALRILEIARDGNSILISGRLESFYHSQLAQEAVRAAVVGIEVVNKIDVS